MTQDTPSISSFLHELPDDMRDIIVTRPGLAELWESLTPLAQNEWICWVTTVKQEKTRLEHLERMSEDLKSGKKRPCCWPGCPHRRESAKKWFQ